MATPLVLHGAFPWANGQGASDIILHLVDGRGNPINGNQMVLTPELEEEISRIVIASYSAYTNLARQNGRQLTTQDLCNVSMKRTGGNWMIHEPPQAPINANTLVLEDARIRAIASKNLSWHGRTVNDALQLADHLVYNPKGSLSSLATSQRSVTPPAPITPPQPIPQPVVAPSIVPTTFTSMPIEPGQNTDYFTPLTSTPTPAKEEFFRFMETTFQIPGINRDLTFRDIYIPSPTEKDLIKRHLEETLRKINSRESLDATQQLLWSKIQEYFFRRMQGVNAPWSLELQRMKEEGDDIFETDQRQMRIYPSKDAYFRCNLGLTEFRNLLRRYDIDQEQNLESYLPNRMSRVASELWNFVPQPVTVVPPVTTGRRLRRMDPRPTLWEQSKGLVYLGGAYAWNMYNPILPRVYQYVQDTAGSNAATITYIPLFLASNYLFNTIFPYILNKL